MSLYTEADQYLHLLSQILAKANRTMVPKKKDDSHTNLYFDSLGNRIVGRWINTGEGDIIFTLNLENQHIEILDSIHQILASVQTISKTIEEVEKNIEDLLPGLGLRKAGFFADLHYEISDYPFKNDPIPSINKAGLKEWIHFRKMANEACSLILGHAQFYEEIKIWPHHFDTGIYFSSNEYLGLGFGLAMEDEMAGAPYFYMSGYPKQGSIDYVELPKGKDWKWELGENWKGAVLPIDQLRAKTDAYQKQIVADFITQTFSWFVKK